jgi:preprotein translocase subunit YajC
MDEDAWIVAIGYAMIVKSNQNVVGVAMVIRKRKRQKQKRQRMAPFRPNDNINTYKGMLYV